MPPLIQEAPFFGGHLSTRKLLFFLGGVGCERSHRTQNTLEVIFWLFIPEWGLLHMRKYMFLSQLRISDTRCGMRSDGSACSAAYCRFGSPFCIASTAACATSPTSRAAQSRRQIPATAHLRANHPHLPHKQQMQTADACNNRRS